MADDVGSSHVRLDLGEVSDAELVRAAREGSRRAYAALYARHSPGALAYARTLSPSDADDVVSEAFLKVYAAIGDGKGPDEDFRFYLRSAVRNTFVSMVRARRTVDAGDAIEEVVGDRGADVASLRTFDGSTTARAFLSLPARWQEVLWYLEVEEFSRERTAEILGMNANAVSALSFRAREALRTAWVQQHVSIPSDLDRGCEAVSPLLGAHSRGGLSRRDRLRVEHHLTGCRHCRSIVDELSELLTPGRLALALLPLVVAGGGFAAWTARFGVGSTSIGSAALASASAAAPSTALLASAGGGAGAAALSVVGKVAACAVVAAMIVPPAQMLIVAADESPVAHHSSPGAIHRAVLSDDTDQSGGRTVVAPLVTEPAAEIVPPDADPGAAERPAWAGAPGGNPNANTGAKGNANAAGGNPNASGNAGGGNPNASGKGNGNAGGGNANANAGAKGNGNGAANDNGNGASTGNGGADGQQGANGGEARGNAGQAGANGAAPSGNADANAGNSANAKNNGNGPNIGTTPEAKGGQAVDAGPTAAPTAPEGP